MCSMAHLRTRTSPQQIWANPAFADLFISGALSRAPPAEGLKNGVCHLLSMHAAFRMLSGKVVPVMPFFFQRRHCPMPILVQAAVPALDLVAAALRSLLGKKEAGLTDAEVAAIHNTTEVLASAKAYGYDRRESVCLAV